jgi:signal transduction histidine kinase
MKQVSYSEHAAEEPAGRITAENAKGGRLLRRTFLIAFLLVSGGLISSGAVELFFRYRESVEAIGALQQEMAQSAAFKIQQFVRDIEKTLRAATQTPEIVTGGLTEPYRFQLIKLLRVAPAVTTATAIDADGREQLKVSRVQMVRPDELADRSAEEAFQRARSGASYFGPVYFVRESEPYMRIAVPIERFAGDVVGVLIAQVNLKYIWEVISQIKVGRTGYAYVVSREGDLIAHPDISLVLQKRSVRELGQVQDALAGAPGPFTARPNLAGEQVFPAYAAIPDLGWAVLVERLAAEAYAPLYASLLRTAVLLLVGLGLALVASLLIGRRVVRPLQTLREGAARIGAGALGYRIDVRTGDELQALAEEFNHMTARLQESYAGLERRVEERTHELSEALEQQTATAEILGVISSSPTDLQPVFQTILENTTRLCEATIAALFLWDGEKLSTAAHHNTTPVFAALLSRIRPHPSHETPTRLAALEHRTVHVTDLLSDPDFSLKPRELYEQENVRTVLSVPMLRERTLVGVISTWRREVRPFTDNQVSLVQTFADQAVIAIENVRLFRELQDRTEQLEIASKHKSQFLANMSHELRTPMNAILGYTELIMDDIYGEVPEKIREVLERVQQSGQHLLGLINAVLDLSKIEAGRLVLSLSDYSLQEVVHTVFASVESLAADKQLALNINIPADLPRGRGDEQRITQVLLNLVGNALKFTEAGEIGIQVTEADETFTVAVSDTGPGISDADQQKIFEEFQQADASSTRQQGGTGLGLAIARKIVELHGGRMWVESSPGTGSTFWFTLPVRVERQKEVAQAHASQPASRRG